MDKQRKDTLRNVLISEVDAAAALDLSPLTLARARRQGKIQPQRILHGGRGKGATFLYDPAYLSRWADENPYFVCPPLIREQRAAQILDCSVQTIARLRKTGKLPAVVKGRFVGYRWDDLKQLQKERAQGSLSDLDQYVIANY